MEVRIGHRARQVLDRNHAFKDKLIEELATERFANVCFIEEPGRDEGLEIKCLGGEAVVVPESSFNMPGIPRWIIDELSIRIK
jgi:hypothetical protein